MVFEHLTYQFFLAEKSTLSGSMMNYFDSVYHDNQSTRNKYCLFVLRFYGPVNPKGSCRARSVYLTTRLLGRLSPLSG